MKVRELLEELENVEPDAEVRIASQPKYPFEYAIRRAEEVYIGDNTVIYLVEGNQIGYLSSEAKEAIGW